MTFTLFDSTKKSVLNSFTKRSQLFCFTTVMVEPPSWLKITAASDKVQSDKHNPNK